jgi:O-antigen ligase
VDFTEACLPQIHQPTAEILSGAMHLAAMNQSVHNDSAAPFVPTKGEHQLERGTLIHASLLLIIATWAFGGNAPWARLLLAVWATLSLPLTVFLLRDILKRRNCLPKSLHCLWPLLGLDILVLVSLLHPGFRTGSIEGEMLYFNNNVSPLIPSSARPDLTVPALWLFNGIYLTCFNLVLAIKSRRSFRILLIIQLVNGLALAVFGTFQKLTHASGLYFGLQPSPQPTFFASFIYHNHWGAYTVLMVAAGLGLGFHYLRRHKLAELVRTPAMLAGIAVTFLALSVPLSSSRSCSVMILFLLLLALLHWARLQSDTGSRSGGINARTLTGMAVAVLLFLGASYKLSEPVILKRMTDTREQLAAIKQSDAHNQRYILYRDTWRMAKDRLSFGWGMGSYPMVFVLYNTQDRGALDRLPHYYHDAHSDWLQSVAELGLVGTGLIILCALVPLWHFRHGLGASPVSVYLLTGTGLILLYAAVEFPFGNTAVIIGFWLCFFTALSYGKTGRTRNA